MPSLSSLNDFVAQNIGTFVHGRWDFVGLAQLYPTLEGIAQLIPRKEMVDNYESTLVYQTETSSGGKGANPGDPVQPVNKKKALRRKVKLVKYVDSIGWVKDQDSLQGKQGEHINKQIQLDLVDFDLHYWQDLENMLLRRPTNLIPNDNETIFGFPAHITDSASIAADTFQLYGGIDPYTGGRPGGISIATQPKFTNPVANFSTISDDSLFDVIEQFLIQRKLIGAVPNPRLLPDTPNDIFYTQLKIHTAVTRYLNASNDNAGVDAGRYRGNPSYKQIPIVVWHALSHPDSPVRPTTAESLLIDWNTFRYSVQRDYDRKIEGPLAIPNVPSSQYITSELWHQLKCDRPDRNLKLVSTTPSLQPA